MSTSIEIVDSSQGSSQEDAYWDEGLGNWKHQGLRGLGRLTNAERLQKMQDALLPNVIRDKCARALSWYTELTGNAFYPGSVTDPHAACQVMMTEADLDRLIAATTAEEIEAALAEINAVIAARIAAEDAARAAAEGGDALATTTESKPNYLIWALGILGVALLVKFLRSKK